MASVDLGAAVQVTWSTVPAGATATISLIRPDGTTFSAPTVTQGPPATASFTPDMAGRWLVRWVSTGAVAAYTDIVDVWPADPRFIISVDDASNALGWTTAGVTPANREDLRLYIAAATPVIEDIVGTMVPKTIVQVANGNSWAVALWENPISVTSVTEAGGSPVTDYVVDYQAGIIYAGRVYAPRRFFPGPQSVVITYMAGAQVIPPNVRLATRELVRHWWQIGKQGLRSMNGQMPITADAWTPSGFAVPRRVIELCAASERTGGFA